MEKHMSKYDILNQLTLPPAKQNQASNQNVPCGCQKPVAVESCAQVESFGSQKSGSQDSGELKLDKTRTFRIVIRFTKEEREYVGSQAEKARLPIANYVRLVVLRLPGLDPERNKLLLKANYELTKQGVNLNQIAKHLNEGAARPDEGDSLLAMITRSLLLAHKSVKAALTEGRHY
jgi:hypothetical protein